MNNCAYNVGITSYNLYNIKMSKYHNAYVHFMFMSCYLNYSTNVYPRATRHKIDSTVVSPCSKFVVEYQNTCNIYFKRDRPRRRSSTYNIYYLKQIYVTFP